MDLRVREVTVGSIVLVAILVFVFGTMWLSGRRVGSGNMVEMQFADVSGLKRASPVRVSGVQVGKVVTIEFKEVGKVRVVGTIPSNIRLRGDATAQIVAVSLVGDYAIDLDPGHSETAPRPVIIGTQEVGLSDRAVALSDRADSVLLGAQRIVNQRTADKLYATLDELQVTLRETQRAMRLLSDTRSGPTADLMKTMASFRALSARLDSTLANPGLTRALGRSDTLVSNLSAMSAQLTTTSARLDSVLAGVNSGRGTIGKFATDSGFYTDIRELSQSMKRVLDELEKHPGKVPVTVKIF